MQDFFTELDADIWAATKRSPQAPLLEKKQIIISSIWKDHAEPYKNESARKPDKRNLQKKPDDASSAHITDMRSQMMKAWVVVLVFKADEKTKTLLWHLKLETRGFVLVDEVREIHKIVIKKARASYEDTVKDVPDIEEKDLIKIIRRDMEIFLEHTISRIPVIIPIILYV